MSSYEPKQKQYPAISPELHRQLLTVPPSQETIYSGVREYRPCSIVTVDGRKLDQVYIMPAEDYFSSWRIWPEDDPAKQSISISDVAEIFDSPSRLPAFFANQIYNAGESGMGYYVFKVYFEDGHTQEYFTGNRIDFIPFPSGQSKSTVVKVSGGSREAQSLKGLDYYWCLYSGIASDE